MNLGINLWNGTRAACRRVAKALGFGYGKSYGRSWGKKG